MRTGAPWRVLPPDYGDWSNTHRRFIRWRDKGIWEKLLEVLINDLDYEWLMMDASYCKAHPHASGARGENQDMSRTSNATPIRTIFRKAFTDAGLPYFDPHSFRNTLVRLGEEVCKTPEQFKAWSQNLGYEKVLTTFLSYGGVACQRQGEIIRDLVTPQLTMQSGVDEFAEAMFKKFRATGVGMQANSV